MEGLSFVEKQELYTCIMSRQIQQLKMLDIVDNKDLKESISKNIKMLDEIKEKIIKNSLLNL